MKKIYTTKMYKFNRMVKFTLFFALLITAEISLAQTETFEAAAKTTGYVNGPLTTPSALGNWQFNNSLIGNTAGSDRFNGLKSARIVGTGSITTLFSKTGGLGTVTVQHALFGTDASSTWKMDVSDNGGASFVAYSSPIITTASTTFATATFTVNVTGNNIRIRISKLSGTSTRINFDDIFLGNYAPSNTITTGAVVGSPFCVSSTSGIAVNVPFTSTGTYLAGNVYTAQLSDNTGSFAAPNDIGNLTSTANTGTIACALPQGSVNGAAYQVRVVSTNPNFIGSNSAAFSIVLNAPDVSNFNGLFPNATTVTLNWNLPVSCYDEILIVAKASTAITSVPTSIDGSAYTANATFGSGTTNTAGIAASEFVVYKNAGGTSATVTGLTTGTTYFFKIYTRKGTIWSTGVSINITPTTDVAGDYRSNGSGTWVTVAIWQTFNGSTWLTATTVPGANISSGSTAGTANVTIRNGHTIVFASSRPNNSILNLTINSGGQLWNSSINTATGNVFLTVYGDIRCDGIIGNPTAGIFDPLSLNMEGANQTISGNGSFNVSRMRKNFLGNLTTNVLMAMPSMNFCFASTAGSSGTQIYNNSGSTTVFTDFNVTVNAGTVVTLYNLGTNATGGNLCIDGTSGAATTSPPENGGTFTINGTIIIPGTLYVLTDNTSKKCTYIIGNSGLVKCVNVCTGNTAVGTTTTGSNSAGPGAELRILNGGVLELTGGSSIINADTYNKPFSLQNSTTAPFTFTAGLGTTNNIFDFQPGSIIRYNSASGTMPVQSQTLVYSNLEITGAAISTINSNLQVNKDLTIKGAGTLSAFANTVNVGGNWKNYSNAGFVEGTSTVNFNGTAAQTITCLDGEVFYNATIANASASGVELNDDVTVTNNLDLGSTGKLFFGQSPHTLTQSNMSAGSNNLLGSGTALIDMSGNAGHVLRIGCESPSFNGSFTAGTGLVNYYSDIVSGTTTGNQTLLSSPSPIYNNLTLSGTGLKTAPSSTVEVKGNLSGEGDANFVNNNGSVLINGSNNQNYTATNPFEFYTLVNNNSTSATGLSIVNDMGIVNNLKLNAATKLNLTTGTINMRSTISKTAYVNQIDPSVSISYPSIGLFYVERYLFAQKAWRFLASPVQLLADDAYTPTIAAAWREGQSAIGVGNGTGYGTAITWKQGPFGAAQELDYNTQRGSIKYYDDANNVWTELSNTTTTKVANTQGYMLFVRGDRGAPNTTTVAGTATNMRIKGKIRTGNQTFAVLAGSAAITKFQSIGNPYPSQINFSGVKSTSTNIADAFFVWNPKLPGLYGVGGYENYVNIGSGIYTLNGQAQTAINVRNTIESGEAFFVQNSTTAVGSVIIKEIDKGLLSNTVSRGAGTGVVKPTIDITLFEKDSIGNYVYGDGLSTSFNNSFNTGIDNDDVVKFTNANDNLFIQSNNKNLVVERRPIPTESDTIKLGLTGTRVGAYRLQIDPYLFNNISVAPFLIDKFLQISIALSIEDSTNYNFNITADAASKAADRFIIVFKQAAINFTTIAAIRNADKTITINWGVPNEKNINNYSVEQSNDGTNFTTLSTQTAIANNGTNPSYSKLDATASKDNNWYKIKINNTNGTVKYSSIAMVAAVKAEIINTAESIAIEPNIITDGNINLHLKNKPTGKYIVQVYNTVGQKTLAINLQVNTNNEIKVIQLGSIAKSKYTALIEDEKGNKITLDFVVN